MSFGRVWLVIKLLFRQGNLYLSRRIVIFAGNLEGNYRTKLLAADRRNQRVRVFNRAFIDPGNNVAFGKPCFGRWTAWFHGDHVRTIGNITPVDLHSQHGRSEEHTSELQSRFDLVCRLLLEKKKYN